MKLKIYNTMTHTKEEFIPLMEDPTYTWPKKDFVWIYSCGPTVYSSPHLWNMRATFVADMIRNVIKNILWYPTKMVSNITDVWHLVGDGDDGEDKMEKWAKKDGITARDVAKKYENEFRDNMNYLNIKDFDYMPRATEYIKEQIELVQILEKKRYTYSIENNGIYMDTSKISDYWKLMWPNYKKRLENLRSWTRVSDDGKRNPTDFALWKFSPTWEQRQMERESPRWIWFPGRHIECSAMSSKLLWTQFDIHHGWKEHVTVHHSDEIAQSECAYDINQWVKYWLHNERLMFDGKKWSKSVWNALTIKDVIDKWFKTTSIRYFYFSTHYKKKQNFNRDLLKQAEVWRDNVIKKLSKIEYTEFKSSSYKAIEAELVTEEWKEFFVKTLESIFDDFNTAKLLAEINKALHNPNPEIASIIHRLDKKLLKLDLFNFDSLINNTDTVEISQEIKDLAEQRREAKQNKDRATADKFRDELKSKWYVIKDLWDSYEILAD